MTGFLIRRRKFGQTHTHTHRAGYEKMETEFVMMNL